MGCAEGESSVCELPSRSVVLGALADCRFIRDDEEPGEVSWEERLARAYESKLFKEFALVRRGLFALIIPTPIPFSLDFLSTG